MERRDFLKMVGVASLVPVLNNTGEISIVSEKSVLLGEFPVAGFQYHEEGRLVEEQSFSAGVALLVQRDTNNPYDPCAVKILTEQNEMLGFLPKKQNMVPASLADQGAKLSARVLTYSADAAPWDSLHIELWGHYPHVVRVS